ncbi:hypothetical protein PQG67_07790 [Corynebacterium pseudodiphtheriticum]|uniref:hypothetical protein n=1 Tax=Corynebacterium pseudodiphtheriticum TaxID=37637 RepID=UPI00234DBC72|nr:hypothetical protein [Corynebacterium pseudodiphtheriticum]MDC7068823.1 hypothetical protein [Corynebacterium pseudodiphtheriticum]MDC7084889.1 hypothetical protein [Corynebacterium pseudodiphtheriticum]MDC7086849.1 hypothetical protein [Corynebacterium pseudodiphtheriticum]
MSNLKLVAGTVKRRGIAIAAAVAVAGGSLATANYAMAVEANEPTQQELEALYSGTEAGNIAAKTADEYKKALTSGASNDQLRQILENGLKSAAQAGDADFSLQDLEQANKEQLNSEFDGIIDSTKQRLEEKNGAQAEQAADPSDTAPQAPAQNPADWASPAPAGKYSPQRLEAEFGGTWQGMIAQLTSENVAKAIREGKSDEEVKTILKNGFKSAGFTEEDISSIPDEELNKLVSEAKTKTQNGLIELNHVRQDALHELEQLPSLNPLQRSVFEKDILNAENISQINTVLTAAKAENENPVAPFAPVPGQKAPEQAGEKTDVEKALAHTKEEALKKLEGFTFLTEQQKEAYKKQVEAATQVFQVEEAFESGEAKNSVNKETKEAQNFVGKAVARTKHLALKQLDDMKNLTHEQKKEARNKIVAATQVFEVEAAFHAAEKLNKATK